MFENCVSVSVTVCRVSRTQCPQCGCLPGQVPGRHQPHAPRAPSCCLGVHMKHASRCLWVGGGGGGWGDGDHDLTVQQCVEQGLAAIWEHGRGVMRSIGVLVALVGVAAAVKDVSFSDVTQKKEPLVSIALCRRTLGPQPNGWLTAGRLGD
jgi:hypothetical protein